MKISLSKSQISDADKFIRRCGYGKLRDRRTGQESYVRRLHRDLYPRFHVYLEERAEQIYFNLHLDQRAAMYEGVTAHSGEYDGEVVEKEATRIMDAAKKQD